MVTVILRDAVRGDSRAIAELFQISSEGLADYIWAMELEPGETLLDAGARRYARSDAAFSFEHCIVVESGGGVIGMAHSFPMPELSDAVASRATDVDPVLAPYAELEAPGSLYVSAIAVREGYRGRGYGTRLMGATVARAQRLGLERISLLCFDENEDALRLYERHSFSEVDRRPVVPHPSLHVKSGHALLMCRAVDAANAA